MKLIYKFIMDKENFKIAYLKNPDPVFFSQLEVRLQEELKKQGAEVIPFDLLDISIECSTEKGIHFYLKKELFEFDAVINYGYMSPFKDVAWGYILRAAEKAGKFILHKYDILRVLDNKLLQGIYYTSAGINVPETYMGFSVESVKAMMSKNFEEREASINKRLVDYAGDGVKKCDYTAVNVNAFAKAIWQGQYSLVQKMVPDSIGKSIRVLLMDGKPFLVAEYQDQSGDFRSNISYYNSFKLENLTNSERAEPYKVLAEKAGKAVGDLLIGGVDILDSKEFGPVVLEINSYPDLYDIESSTGVDPFVMLAKTYCDRARAHLKKNK
jgi:glutathione synthase/RimK-type ligase-like ATP-grasp enzyme